MVSSDQNEDIIRQKLEASQRAGTIMPNTFRTEDFIGRNRDCFNYIVAPGEADVHIARNVITTPGIGRVLVVGNDSDYVAAYCQVEHLAMPVANSFLYYEKQAIQNAVTLSAVNLQLLAVLSGSDYAPNVKTYGPSKLLKILKRGPVFDHLEAGVEWFASQRAIQNSLLKEREVICRIKFQEIPEVIHEEIVQQFAPSVRVFEHLDEGEIVSVDYSQLWSNIQVELQTQYAHTRQNLAPIPLPLHKSFITMPMIKTRTVDRPGQSPTRFPPHTQPRPWDVVIRDDDDLQSDNDNDDLTYEPVVKRTKRLADRKAQLLKDHDLVGRRVGKYGSLPLQNLPQNCGNSMANLIFQLPKLLREVRLRGMQLLQAAFDVCAAILLCDNPTNLPDWFDFTRFHARSRRSATDDAPLAALNFAKNLAKNFLDTVASKGNSIIASALSMAATGTLCSSQDRYTSSILDSSISYLRTKLQRQEVFNKISYKEFLGNVAQLVPRIAADIKKNLATK